MKDIAALLFELTTKQDHVSLPTLGAFIKKGNILTFDENEKWNDGKLENYYAKTYNIPLLTAQQDIQMNVEQIAKVLQQSKRYLLANFGLLYINAQNTLEFSDQLSSFSATPPITQLHTKKHINPQNNHRMITKRNLKIWVSIVVVIAAGCMTIMLLMFYPKISNHFHLSKATKDTTIQNVGVEEVKTDETLTTLPYTTTTEIEIEPTTPTSQERYYVVVASETTKEKAIEKSKEFKLLGYQPDIVEHHGKFRIYIGRYSDQKTAKKELNQILAKVPDAWLFKL